MHDGGTSHVVRDGRRVRSRRRRAATLRNARDFALKQIGGTLALDKYLQMVRQLLAEDGPADRPRAAAAGGIPQRCECQGDLPRVIGDDGAAAGCSESDQNARHAKSRDVRGDTHQPLAREKP
jgi:hypothetical protein